MAMALFSGTTVGLSPPATITWNAVATVEQSTQLASA